MAASNSAQAKAGYNNIQVGYITPDSDPEGINFTNDTSYPASGAIIVNIDTANNALKLMNDIPLSARNAANSGNINILKLNASDKLETGSTLDLNWQTFTPSAYGGTGRLTFTSVSEANNFYYRFGDMAFIHFRATGTTGDTTSTELTFTLPLGLTAQAGNLELGVSVFESSGMSKPGRCYSVSGTEFHVSKYDASNFVLAASTGFIVQGVLRLA